MNVLSYTTFDTPAGEFSIAVDRSAAVVAAVFGDHHVLASRLRADDNTLVRDDKLTANARAQVLAYFSGKRTRFELRYKPAGTAFQQKVWRLLERIPFGETRTYGSLANTISSSPRAIGQANGANPICLLIPCHRVVGANGSLTGYAFGSNRKRALLAHETAADRSEEPSTAKRWHCRSSLRLAATVS